MSAPIQTMKTREVEISFPVTGMTCASCVNRVEKAIAKVEGVDSVAVNLATERATVTYDPETATVTEIAQAVERAGYGVADLPQEAVPAPAIPPPMRNGRDNGVAPAVIDASPGEALLPIEGMTCASCVRRVEKSLAAVPGVADANVNFATEQAVVRFDPVVTSRPELRAAAGP
jgi:copper ion binding protein